VHGHAATLHAVSAAWADHHIALFPTVPSAEKADLVLLDATAAGCISMYLQNDGRLDASRCETLRRCLPDLRRSLRRLGYPSGHYRAFAYFLRLLKMSEMVVNDVLPFGAGAAATMPRTGKRRLPFGIAGGRAHAMGARL
jgi:hypothetical protein